MDINYTNDATEKWVHIEDVAEHKHQPDTARAWLKDGKLPHIKLENDTSSNYRK